MGRDIVRLQADRVDRHWWFRGRRRILARLVEHLVSAPARIVDVGCGTGENLGSLSDRYTRVGIEPSREAIEAARARFPAVRFLHGAVAEHEAELRAARLVLLMDVLEHVTDDRTLLTRIIMQMQPEAHLLVTVPAEPSLWSEHDEALGHERRYTIDGLNRLWERLPVETRLLTPFNSRLFPAVKAFRWLKRQRPRSELRPRADLWLPPRTLNRALESIFAGEADRLIEALQGRRPRTYGRGASLLAILRRT